MYQIPYGMAIPGQKTEDNFQHMVFMI